ncbi:hypothetical protein PAGU2595_028560 [Lysobacter xanthus]
MNELSKLAACLFLTLCSSEAAANCLHYDPPSIEITGRISAIPFTLADWSTGAAIQEPEYSWSFTTAHPICIAAGDKRMGNVAFGSVQQFQILAASAGLDLSRFVGTTVILRGQFLPSQLPHHHHLTFSVESARVRHAP